MNIDDLREQCSTISCLADEQTKLMRKIAATALRAAERSVAPPSTVFGLNSLCIHLLTRSLHTLSLVYGMVNELAGPDLGHVESAPDSCPNVWPDNLVELQSQFHSNP